MAPSRNVKLSRELQATREKRKQLLETSKKYEEGINLEGKKLTETIQNFERNFSTIQKNIEKGNKQINETKKINERNASLQKSRLLDRFNRAKQEQEQLMIRQENESREVKHIRLYV